VFAACGGTRAGHRATDGAIAGMTRDAVSGGNVGLVDIEAGGHTTTSNKAGIYDVDHLPPGRYDIHARYAGQDVTVKNVTVDRGVATYVDIELTLGLPPVTIDWATSRDTQIRYYAASSPYIEGTVEDANTRSRVAGAVVTATYSADTLQTVTDDAGRFRFDNVQPATYAVSAYYSMGGRGQIEVRRSDIVIEPGHAARGPLQIELPR
jgi:hypothetical protein